ncbi:flavodoxin family protein [Sphingomonas sp. CGMCC 1.13654]|uniref:Flavodoxin family protein n=1 Tax=Sphingomonas chungangi TaxID=2683589 RepID=A0A838L948_9SPHN|nr:NAD(P)H-dependent oxidoreductase [Sphingomonas chungangi]MBA2935547.1 flavodoxin family protein [Sphingomonas chungangi]MVW54240.1 NADPH-dependent oxidoreductase [Sphingomonas chungangi]
MLVQSVNCTLKASGESSTDAMIAVLAKELEAKGATVAETVRAAAFNIRPGVTSDEGDGDDWPHIREKIVAADILILGTPIWMGSAGSVAKRVMERMDAFLEETDDQGRMPSYGKVAVTAIVGNEDGAHFASAQIFQALNDVGWTIPAVAACYWVGEAMGSTDFKDLDETPKMVAKTAKMVASNAVHLASLLKDSNYPG